MKYVKVFVYDFDGTLVDSKLDIADSLNLALAEMNLRDLPRKTIFGYVGQGVEHLLTRALEGTGDHDISRGIALFKKHYNQHLLDQTDFFPQSRETVIHFGDKHHAIFSNKPSEFITRILSALDFLYPFKLVLGGDSLDKKKPDPSGLYKIMEACQAEPHEVVMVGDSVVDIEAGQRAGVLTCAITHGMTDAQTLRETRPDWLIDHFASLKTLFH